MEISQDSKQRSCSFLKLITNGRCKSNSAKMKRLQSSFSWRQSYLNTEFYIYEFEDSKKIQLFQIANGEISGLGTGAQVWPAAHVLCKYLEKNYLPHNLRGRRVCDLGSGTGIVGLVAASLGAEVVLTDQDQIISLLDRNKSELCSACEIEANLIDVKVFDWGGSADHLGLPFDLIVVSDCVLPKLYPIEPLVEAISSLMDDNSLALLSYEHRPYHLFDPRQEFYRLALNHGLEVHIVPLQEHHEIYSSEEIELWKIRRIRTPPIPSRMVTRNIGTTAMTGEGDDHFASVDINKIRDFSEIFPLERSMRASVSGHRNNRLHIQEWGDIPEVHVVYQTPPKLSSAEGNTAEQNTVKIRQNTTGATGCYLWPSSVILSRSVPLKSQCRY